MLEYGRLDEAPGIETIYGHGVGTGGVKPDYGRTRVVLTEKSALLAIEVV